MDVLRNRILQAARQGGGNVDIKVYRTNVDLAVALLNRCGTTYVSPRGRQSVAFIIDDVKAYINRNGDVSKEQEHVWENGHAQYL